MTQLLNYGWNLACLVNDLKDDRHRGVDGGVSMKALEADLFECTDEEVIELNTLTKN